MSMFMTFRCFCGTKFYNCICESGHFISEWRKFGRCWQPRTSWRGNWSSSSAGLVVWRTSLVNLFTFILSTMKHSIISSINIRYFNLICQMKTDLHESAVSGCTEALYNSIIICNFFQIDANNVIELFLYPER